MNGHFNVLKPIYTRDGVNRRRDGSEESIYAVTWEIVGAAKSMEDARTRFGGRPAMEWVPARRQGGAA